MAINNKKNLELTMLKEEEKENPVQASVQHVIRKRKREAGHKPSTTKFVSVFVVAVGGVR